MEKPLCYLCDAIADTSDHVPPKGFYPKPYPPNLLTVPCCKKCNHSLSPLDEEMRVYLAAEEHANSAARLMLESKVFRPDSIKGRAFRTAARTLRDLPTAHGTQSLMSPKTQDLFAFVDRITRGLICKYYPHLHSIDAHIAVECLSAAQFKEEQNAESVQQIMAYLKGIVPSMHQLILGDGVLDCFHQIAFTGPKPSGTVWIISFYQGATFLVVQSLTSCDGTERLAKIGARCA